MNRRDFLIAGAAMAAAVRTPRVSRAAPFPDELRLAPHAGMFSTLAGDDPVDQILWAADRGFAGFEDARIAERPLRRQEQIASALSRRGMEMGPVPGIVELAKPLFTSGRADHRAETLRNLERGIACARRANARWVSVLPGRGDPRLPASRQHANLLALLEECADACARANVGLLIEPIDAGRSRAPLVVTDFEQAVALCAELGHPACRVLCDVYRLASPRVSELGPRTTDDVLSRLERGVRQVGHVHWGDAPGRKEPGTGILDFHAIAAFLGARGYSGLVGLEHGNSRPGHEGELAVLRAYGKLAAARGIGQQREEAESGTLIFADRR